MDYLIISIIFLLIMLIPGCFLSYWSTKDMCPWEKKKYWVKIAKNHSIKIFGVPDRWEEFFKWDWREKWS